MIQDGHIVQIKRYNLSFSVDLEELVGSAGKTVQNLMYSPQYDPRLKVVSVPVARARKLLRLIDRMADPDDVDFVHEYMRTHPNKIGAW